MSAKSNSNFLDQLLNINEPGVSSVIIHPSEDSIYTCGGVQGLIHRLSNVWNKETEVEIKDLDDEPAQTNESPFTCLEFLPNNNQKNQNQNKTNLNTGYFVVGCEDGEVSLFAHPSASYKALICKFRTPAISISSSSSATNSSLIACASVNAEINVYELKYILSNNIKQAMRVTFRASESDIRSIQFLPNFKQKQEQSQSESDIEYNYLAVCSCIRTFDIWRFGINASDVKNEDANAKKGQSQSAAQKICSIKDAFPKIGYSQLQQKMQIASTRNVC
jgi:cell division septum initiation protein DivIVA